MTSEAAQLGRRRKRELPPDEYTLEPKDASDARQVPLGRLKPAPWNPRKIDSERFKNLVASVQADPEFLRLRPILAQEDGTIYAGNMRYRSAQQLGYTSVWAIIGDVDDQTAKERAIRDNNEWGIYDDDMLGEMLNELREQGSDVGLLGFNDKELDAFMSGDGLPPPGDQASESAPPMWGVIVTCSDELQQADLLGRLSSEGYAVRALMA